MKEQQELPYKRMQMDLLKRYALSSATDAGRYVADGSPKQHNHLEKA